MLCRKQTFFILLAILLLAVSVFTVGLGYWFYSAVAVPFIDASIFTVKQTTILFLFTFFSTLSALLLTVLSLVFYFSISTSGRRE